MISESHPDQISTLLERITVGDGTSVAAAAASFCEVAKQCGLRVVAFHDLSSKNFIQDEDGNLINETVFGWDEPEERWWDEPLVGLTSPVALSARYEHQAFWVNKSGPISTARNPHLEAVQFRSFFETETEFRSMIIVPVHQPFGRVGVVCYFPVDKETANLENEFRRHSWFLSILGSRFLRNFDTLDNASVWLPENCTLTRRQVQCLHWASLGKTDQEVGSILSLSHAAVRYHVGQAIDRLECVNRTQAVFKAGQLGYLGAIH